MYSSSPPMETMISTTSISSTKLAIATACLFAMAGISLAVLPVQTSKSPAPKASPSAFSYGYGGATPTCYADSFSFSTSTCRATYRQAEGTCYDGQTVTTPPPTSTCNTAQYLYQQLATQCTGHCQGNKCGLSSSGIIPASSCASEYASGEFTCRGGAQNGVRQYYNGCTKNDAAFATYANTICQVGCTMPGLPDFIVTTTFPHTIQSPTTTFYYISTIILNLGTVDGNMGVLNVAMNMKDGTVFKQDVFIPTWQAVLTAGGSTNFDIYMGQAVAPTKNITDAVASIDVTVDIDNITVESNERNNTLHQ